MELLYGIFGPGRVWSRTNSSHEFNMMIQWPAKSPVCKISLQCFRSSVMRVGSDTFDDPIFQKGLQN